MQHKTNATLITPAAYARSLRLNRSTISRQIANGVIPTHGGLVDPEEADRARKNNLDISRRLAGPDPERSTRNSEDVGEFCQGLMTYGMMHLSEWLREPARQKTLSDVLTEISLTPEQARQSAALVIYLISAWIDDWLIYVEPEQAKKYRRQLKKWGEKAIVWREDKH